MKVVNHLHGLLLEPIACGPFWATIKVVAPFFSSDCFHDVPLVQFSDPSNFKCALDPKVTAESIMNFREEIGQMWGDACGRNRGVFVLNPPDGHTYGEFSPRTTLVLVH